MDCRQQPSGGRAWRHGLVGTLLTALLLAPWAWPSSAGATDPRLPVVLLHGWGGIGAGWSELVQRLTAAGVPVLDFEPGVEGVQALSYAPTDRRQHVPYLAAKIVQPQIQQALGRAGYPADQKVDVVAHSMGGLIARFLIEHPGADVDHWRPATSPHATPPWHGDGIPDVASDWASRIDDLVMLGTPNHGTWLGWVPHTVGHLTRWGASGGDLRPQSRFLRAMGIREPAGEHYTSVGGNPRSGAWARYDYDGDGVRHGFDGVVPAESPYVEGCDFHLVRATHFGLRRQPAVLDIVVAAVA